MATGADIPVPICEIRTEGERGNIVDQVDKLPLEEKIQVDTHKEPPTTEGEKFLKTPSIGEVHCEVNTVLSDANKVIKPVEKESLANEGTSSKGNEQDDERAETQLSKDATGDHHVINETELENLNVQVKTEDDISLSIASDVSKGDCLNGQNTMTPEQERLDNQRNIAEKLDAAVDVISQENITFTETKNEAASNSDDLDQSKNQEKTSDAVSTQKEVLERFSTVISSCPEEGLSEDLQVVKSYSTDRKIIEVDTKKEVLENFSTISTEENSMINVDGSEEYLGKENKETSSQLPLAREVIDDKSPVTHEARIEEEELREAESCENEKSKETTLLKIEAELEKPNDSLCVTSEDVKASDLVLDRKTDDETVDATEKEETHENLGAIVSNEKREESLLIGVDGSHMETEAYLEKEIEKTSLKEVSPDDATDESTIIDDAKIGDEYLRNSEKNIDSTQDCKEAAASEDIETTCSLEEQSLSTNPQAIMSNKTVDATETKEATLENVGTTASKEDCSKMEHEDHLEKESGASSSTEAPKEDYNHDESKKMNENENRDEDVINTELLENEKYTSNLVKEEAHVEKAIDSSQIANKDVNEYDSSQDTKVSSIEEQILTTDAQVETFEDIAAYVPNEDDEDNSPIEEDSPQKPSLEEASTCNINKDESAIIYKAKSVDESSTKADLFKNEKNVEDTLVKEKGSMESLQVAAQDIEALASIQVRETSFLEEQLAVNCKGTTSDPKEDKTNDSTSLEEGTTQDKNVATIIPYQDTKEKSLCQDDCSQVEEKQPIDSLQVAIKDTEASASRQDTEPSSIEEQIPTKDEILGENKDAKMIDPPHKNEETTENIATTIPHEDIQENSLIQVDCSEKEHEEHVGKESEIPSLKEAATEEISEDQSKSIHEPENKEEADFKKPIDSSQVNTDEVNESDSCQDINVRSIEEQILTTIPQGISSDKMEGKTIDANDIKEATPEDNATNFSNRENESPVKEDGSQKPYLEEDPIDSNNDDESTIKHEAEFVDETSTKADLSKNEKKTEDTSVKEEVSIESSQEAAGDNAAFASFQDKETSYVEEQSLNINREGTISDHKEDERNDATNVKEETPQDKNVGTIVLYEDMQEKSLDQDDCSRVEQIEHLEKEIQNQSLTGALTQDTKESTLVVEEPPVEKAIDSLQETTHEKILNTEGIFGNETEENIIDLPYKNDETLESIATTTLYDDTQGDLVIQMDSSTMEHEEHLEKASENPSMTEIATKETNEDDSRNPEPKNRNDDAIKTELLENEKYTKEKACLEKPSDLSHVDTKDIDESDSNKDTRMSSIEEQIPAGNPQEIPSDKIEGKTIDAAEMEEKILEDIAAYVPSEDNEDNSPIEEDGSQKPSLEEASTCNINKDESAIIYKAKSVDESSTKADLFENEKNVEDTLVKEEASMESLQVAAQDIEALASIHVRETSFLEEQRLAMNCKGKIDDHKEDKTNDSTSLEEGTTRDKNVAMIIPYEDTKEKSLCQDDCSRMEQNEHLEKESTSLVEEKQPIDSLQVAIEDTEASASGQDTEPSSIEEQIPTKDEILGENKEEKMIDPPHKIEETAENVATTVPHEEIQENSLIQVDCSEKEHEEHVGKESEIPSLKEAATEEISEDQSKSIHEPENKEEADFEKPIDSSQVDTDDVNESDSCQDTNVSSIKEQVLTTIPQGIPSDKMEGKTIDANDIKEATLEDNATNFSNRDNESPIKEDGSQKPYLEEDPIDSNNDDELTIKHEAKFVDESSTKADLSKNEKKTEDTSVKEEVSIESSQEAVGDNEAFVSFQDKGTSYVEEQSLNINRAGTISDHKEDERNDATGVTEETPQDKNVGTTILYEDMQEKSLDQDDCSRVEQNEHLEREIENQSLTGALTQDTKESTSVMEESPVEKAIDSLQETTHEKILNTEEIFGNDTEENIIDLPYKNDETLESIATTTLYDDTQGDLVIQMDSSTMEHEEHLEKESENPSMTEIATKETNEEDSRNIPEPKNRNDDAIKTELMENEKYTKEESCLEKLTDLSQVETKDIDESDSNQDTRMSSIEDQILAGNPQEIPSDKIEGKTIDAAEMEEKLLEDIAANVPTGETKDNLPIEEDGSQKPCLEEASTLSVNEDKSTTMHEVKYVDESLRKIDLLENDKDIEDNLEKEEVSIKSLQVMVENIKASASIQDKETSSLKEQSVNINCQEIIGEHNEDKISNAIGVKEETPEDKNVTTSVPYKGAEQPSLNEGDCLRMEHKEHLEEKSEIPSLTETPTEKTNDDEPKNIHELEYRDEDLIRTELLENENCIESTLGKEEAQVEKCINSMQVSSEDIKASDSSQDTKLGSFREQILIVETQEISGGKIEERTIDATDLREDILEDTTTNVLDGDNEGDSPIEEDDSQKTSLDEGKFVDESSVKDGLLETEKNIEDTSVKKEVFEDIRAFDSVQDIETSSLKGQTLAADCQGIIGDDIEEKTNTTSVKGQTSVDENVSTTIPFEDKEEKSQEQDDRLQMEHHTNKSQILSEAPAGDTEERNLIIKEVKVEKHADSLQVASEESEDIKATASCQNTKTSCIEEQILSTNPQGISCDIIEEKTINATHMNEETVEVQNVTTTISHEETEENSLNQVDCPQMEQKEQLDKGSENLSSLTKASTEDNIEKTLVKEEPQVEKLIDSFQVANENIKASTSGPNLETSSIEEKIQSTDPQELSDCNIEEKSIDAICNKEETLEDMATNVSNGDNEDSLPTKVDEPQKPSLEEASTGNATDYEPTIMPDARFADEDLIKADLFENEKNTEDILVKDEVCIESVQVAAEDIKFSTLGQDREISSLQEQSLPPNPQAITGDHKEDKRIDATNQKEETPEDKNVATSVPQEDNEKDSIILVDCSQTEYEKHLGEESENSSSTKAPTMKEEINEDTKPATSSQDMKINSLEETILTEDSQEISRDNTEEKTIVATGKKEETLKVQVSKEIENVDIKAKTTDLNVEEGYLSDTEMTTAVIIVAHENQVSDSSAIRIPSVNKDIMVDIVDPKCKQEESSISNVSEEHINISKNVADVTILAPEASELSGDHQVIKEANSCSDTTDAVKIGFLDDGSTTVPSNENLVQIVAKESTDREAQVRAGEKEVKLTEQEPEAGIDQKKIEEELPISASHDASKANGMNGEEDNRSSDYGNEISESSDSVELQEVSSSNVASEELSTSDPFLESTRVMKQEAVSEETQKQDEDLHVLAPVNVALDELSTSNPLQESIEVTKQEAIQGVQKQDNDLHVSVPISDSSVENIKNDVQLCLTSAHVSDITQEMQKLDEASRPSAEEKIEEIIEKTDREESEVVENSTQDKYNEHLEQDDTTKSFLDDKKLTESERKEEECTGEKSSTSVPVANSVPPTSSKEPSEAEKELKTDTTESAVSLEDDLINSRSIVDLETKIDQATEITETTPTVTGGQETESRSVGETSVLISQCEKDDNEHASVGNIIEDKSDSNAVQVEHEENKSINESKNQVLDSIAQVQSCDIISKAEEMKTHEQNLEATIEINSVAEDISRPKEIMKVDISSNKIKKEDGDVDDYYLGSCMDEVITTNSQEDEVKQEEKINTEEILDEVIKHANDTEKVPKVSEEISSSNVASEEFSTSDPFQESTRVREQVALSEEAQKQDKDLTNIEKDVELCLTSAHVSDVTQEIQKLEEASVENLEQDDSTKSFLDDKKLTEIAQEEKECKGEKGFTSVPVANAFPPMSSMEPLEAEKKLKDDTTESAVSLEDNLINSRSLVNLESKIDDQALEITVTAPNVTGGQETESRSVGETSVLISQCEKDEYEHVRFGSVTEEKSDSNEVEFAHEETKRVNQSKNQVQESSAQVQGCDIISNAEEVKTDEENHEAAIDINSVADDISEPKEIIKIKREDEDVEDYHLGSCTEGVITKNRQEDVVKQEGKTNTEETLDEVITNANDTGKVPKVSEEADDKAMVEPDDNLLANESIDGSFHQEECGKSVEEFISASDIKEAQVLDHIHTKTETKDSTTEVNSSSEAFLVDGDNGKGADGIDNESAKDEVLPNQNTNKSVLDSAAQSKRHHENIPCDAAPTKTVQKPVEETEDKKECTNTIMMEQQHEDNINKNKSLPLPEFAPGKESEKRDQKDEICSSRGVQAKDEENQMVSAGKRKEEAHEANIPDEDEDSKTYAKAEKLEFLADAKNPLEVSHSDGAAHSIPEDNENSTTINECSEEKYQNKRTESQVSTVSKNIELIEERSNSTRITAETQDIEAQSFSSVVPEQMGVDSQQVEELSDECKGMTKTSTSIQPSKISTSEIILQHKVGSSSEAKDPLTELHSLLQESRDMGSEVKMTRRDGPVDLHNVTNVRDDVQKLKEGFVEVLNKQNLVEANPNENVEATISSEGHEAEAIQKALTSETFKPEIQEQQPGRTREAVIEAKASNHQSSLEDATQSVENKESQRQEELMATSLPAKAKNATLEADHTENVNPENSLGNKSISVIQDGSPAEYSQGEGEDEMLKPSKCELEEAHCGQETTKSEEKYNHSLSDIPQVSMKESSQTAYHCAIEKEPIIHTKDLQEEKADNAELSGAKTDEEKDEEEESSERRRLDLGSEAPVMVEARDRDVKVTHKKSHNILSGVGSKVKHSIAKVKKAITGKSSHPKPSSPKEGEKHSKTVVS